MFASAERLSWRTSSGSPLDPLRADDETVRLPYGFRAKRGPVCQEIFPRDQRQLSEIVCASKGIGIELPVVRHVTRGVADDLAHAPVALPRAVVRAA